MEKPLADITRTEWIKYQWFDATQMGDDERIMGQGFLRTPEESYQAMMEWEETAEERMEPDEEKGTVQ